MRLSNTDKKKPRDELCIEDLVRDLAEGDLTVDEYIKTRVAPGVEWYRTHGDQARSRYLWMRGIAVIGGAIVPVLVNVNSPSNVLSTWVTTILSLVVVIFVSLEGVLHYREQWKNYRSTSSALEHEFFSLKTNSRPYDRCRDKQTEFKTFVQRVETYIGHEVASTLSIMTLLREEEKLMPGKVTEEKVTAEKHVAEKAPEEKLIAEQVSAEKVTAEKAPEDEATDESSKS